VFRAAAGAYTWGAGAAVGKLLGPWQATKSGIGSASLRVGRNVVVGAIVAVNALGDVLDPETGQILAGTRSPEGGWAGTARLLLEQADGRSPGFSPNTTAVSIAGPSVRLTRERILGFVDVLKATAQVVSRNLGYLPRQKPAPVD
jgi:L-aminopeptidase/D-esterase-like protein